MSLKKNQTRTKPSISPLSVVFFTIVTIFPIIWISLYALPVSTTYSYSVSVNQVRKTFNAAKQCSKSFQKTPENLNILKHCARSSGKALRPYDGYGRPIDFQSFATSEFIARSFASDGVQYSLGKSPDIALASWRNGFAEGVATDYQVLGKQILYPAIVLEGSRSKNGQWIARLVVSSNKIDRHLVIINRLDPNRFFLAPHNMVEEFLWLPDSNRLVFSATGSKYYNDGIYLWDLRKSGVVENLLDANTSGIKSDSSNQRYWISLKGIQQNSNLLTLLAHVRLQSDVALSPDVFFKSEHVFPIDLKTSRSRDLPIRKRNVTWDMGRFGSKSFGIDWQNQGSEIQRRWLRLPLNGTPGSVLEEWQKFANQFASSPLFSYSLWYLTILYQNSLDYVSEKEAEILRAYCLEVVAAMASYSPAPSYVKAIGKYYYLSMKQGKGDRAINLLKPGVDQGE